MRPPAARALAVAAAAMAVLLGCSVVGATGAGRLHVVSESGGVGDLGAVLRGPVAAWRSMREALEGASAGDAVVCVSEGFPARAGPGVSAAELELVRRKRLSVLVEYPARVGPVASQVMAGDPWSRLVVASEDLSGDGLPALRVLTAHAGNYTSLPFVGGLQGLPAAPRVYLQLARVAGYRSAVFGAPEGAVPVLYDVSAAFALPRPLLVAATRLSAPVTMRMAPAEDARRVWTAIVRLLGAAAWVKVEAWRPTVHPEWSREAVLPRDARLRAARAAWKWLADVAVVQGAAARKLCPVTSGSVNGSAAAVCVAEGFSSQMDEVGRQVFLGQSVRVDCASETSMALEFASEEARARGALEEAARLRALSDGLWRYLLGPSGAMVQSEGAASYGLLRWTLTWDQSGGWDRNYGDDNARSALALAVAASSKRSGELGRAAALTVLALLRTTSVSGMRASSISLSGLDSGGWESMFQSVPGPSNYNVPHYQAEALALFIWLHARTGLRLPLQRAEAALGVWMAQLRAAPGGAAWSCTEYKSEELSRVLLPLAFLVRATKRAEHAAWLAEAVDAVLQGQDSSGAVRETLCQPQLAVHGVPSSNGGYHAGEAAVIQEDGDPVADSLYTQNFLVRNLHEAAAVLGNATVSRASAQLAEFLVRTQLRSKAHPELQGAWARAFSYGGGLWEVYGSDADMGWGAFALESGWSVTWISQALWAMERDTTLWDQLGAVPVSRAQLLAMCRSMLGALCA